MKLTKKAITELETTGKRYTVMDDDFTGLAVRVGATGTKRFYYIYRFGKGRSAPLRWYKLGAFPVISVQRARELAKLASAEVVQGRDPIALRKEFHDMPLFKETFEVFLEEHVEKKRKQSTLRQYSGLARRSFYPTLGKLKIGDITAGHVSKLHASMHETPYLANRAASVLSKFFSWCESRGIIRLGSNPAKGHDRYTEHKRIRFMQDEELNRFGQALALMESKGQIDIFVAGALRLLIFTGARLSEVLSLRWEYIDMEAGVAYLPDSKTGAKPLHLATPALNVLKSLPHINIWCFPSKKTEGHIVNIRKSFISVCKSAELTGWRIHDLRHAFASAAVTRGHSLPMIGALLGHSQPSTTHRYAHIANNPVHNVAEDTAVHLELTLQKK